MNRLHRLTLPIGPLTLFVCLVAIGASGCASSGADVTAPPPEPAKKPFTPPSFEAKAYENDELGFSIHYPSDFAEQDSQGGLFSAASTQQVPRVDVALLPLTEDSVETFGEQVAASYSQLGGGEATIVSAKEVILQDGVTQAMEFVVDWSFQGFPIKSLALFAPTGDRLVQVSVTWAEAFGDRDSQNIDEIAYSLYFD